MSTYPILFQQEIFKNPLTPESEVYRKRISPYQIYPFKWDEILQPHSDNSNKPKIKPNEESDDDEDDERLAVDEWEIKMIVDCALPYQWATESMYFRVRWVGFGAEDDTWEPREKLSDSQTALTNFVNYVPYFQKLAVHFLEKARITIRRCIKKCSWSDQFSSRMSGTCQEPDICVLYILAGKYFNETSTWRNVTPTEIAILQEKIRLGLAKNDPKRPKIKGKRESDAERSHRIQTFNEIARKLNISPFDLLDATLLHMSRRKVRMCRRIICYTETLSHSIQQTEGLDELPDILVENWFDHELPNDFEYIASCLPVGQVCVRFPADKEGKAKMHCNCVGVCKAGCKCLNRKSFNDYFNDTKLKYVVQTNAIPRTDIRTCLEDCNCSCSVKSFDFFPDIGFTIFRTKQRGWGLRSSSTILKGQFVTSYVGEIIDEKERSRRCANGETTYMLDLDFESFDSYKTVDSMHKGNLSRFINHSCNPNLCIHPIYDALTPPDCPRVGFFALYQIPAGEELTFDYSAPPLAELVVPPHTKVPPTQKQKPINTTQNTTASFDQSSAISSLQLVEIQSTLSNNYPSSSSPTPGPSSSSPTPGPSNSSPIPGPSGMQANRLASIARTPSSQSNQTGDSSPSPHTSRSPKKNSEDAYTLQPCKCGRKLCRGYIF